MFFYREGNHLYFWITVLVSIALIFSIQKAEGANERSWSVSPLLGIHSPSLDLLNNGEFKAKLPTKGSLVLDPEGTSFDFSFIVENSLPKIDFGTESGLEFTFPIDDHNALIMGVGTWEGGSSSAVITTLAFQGVLNKVGYERSGKASYTQYFFGWRRDLIQRPKKYMVYSKLLLHEVFDFDYKETLVLDFRLPTGETFKRVVDMESQTTGIMMFQLGVGGEYFLKEWFSLGLDVGYSFTPRSFKLNNSLIRTDIQESDDFELTLPARRHPNTGELNYLDQNNTYRPLSLKLDGLHMLFRLNIYY